MDYNKPIEPIQYADTAPEVLPEERSTAADLIYNSNSIGAGLINTFGDEKLRIKDDLVQAEKDSGYEFSYSNPEVVDYLKTLPNEVVSSLGSVDSWEELTTKVERIKYGNEGMQNLVEDFGTAGTMAAMLPSAILDWDTFVGVGLITKTKKALDFYKVNDSLARSATYGLVGGTEAMISDAVYQQVVGTNNTDQRLMSFLAGGVLSSVASKYLLDKPENPTVRVEDPVFGPRKPTSDEVASARIQEGELRVRESEESLEAFEARAKDLETRIGDVSARTVEADSVIKTAKPRLKELESELKVSLRNDARVRFDDAKIKNEEAKQAKKNYTQEMRVATRDQKKYVTSLAKLEDKVAKGKAKPKDTEDIKVLKKDIKDIESEIKTLKAKEKDLTINEIATGRERARAKVTTSKEEYKGRKTEEIQEELTTTKRNLDEASIKYNNNKRNLDRYKKLQKNRKPIARELKASIETNTSRVSKALNALHEVSLENIKEAGEGKLALNWFEKAMVWTPGSNMYSSDNQILRGLASKLVSPFKSKTVDGIQVPTQPNAMFFKSQFNAYYNEMYVNTMDSYSKAIKDEGFKGSYKEFMTAVGTEFRKSSGKAHREAHLGLTTNIKSAEELDSLLSSKTVTMKFEGESKAINEAATHLQTFYGKYGKTGKDLKASGFVEANLDGTYMNRAFDFDKIQAMGRDNAVAKIAQALQRDPRNMYSAEGKLMTPEDFVSRARGVVDKVSERGIMYDLIKAPEGKPTANMQKQRTLSYYEDDLLDLLSDDVSDITMAYNYKMSGRLALHKALGVSTPGEIQNLYSTLTNEGAFRPGSKDLQNLSAVVDTVLGTREIMKNPTTFNNTVLRTVTKANGMIYGMGFGLTSMTEIANVIGTTGFKNTLGNHFSAIEGAFKMAKAQEVPTVWLNELKSAGIIGDIVHGLHLQRYDASDTISTAKGLERYLDLGQHYVHKMSGLLHVTEATRALALGSGFNYIAELARKPVLTKVEMNRLNRIGIDSDTLNQVRGLLDNNTIKYNSKGQLESFNFNAWGDELTDKIQFSLFNHMNDSVLHPDGTTLPLFMSDPESFVAKIMFQFLRFPAAAHEKLFLRGLNEADINTVTGIMSSLALFTMVSQIKHIGDDRYDLSTEDGRARTMAYLASNNSFGASLTTGADTISSLLIGQSPMSEYRAGADTALGVTANTLGKVQQIGGKIIQGEPEDAFKTTNDLVNHIPIVSAVTDYYWEK